MMMMMIACDECCGQKLGKTATEVFADEGEATWRKQENLGLGAVSPSIQPINQSTITLCMIDSHSAVRLDLPYLSFLLSLSIYTILQLQTFVQTVVSTGGGVMQQKDNFPFLHSGLIIWLDLPVCM